MSNDIKQFERHIQSKGGVPLSLYPWEIKYVVETKAGLLYVSVHRSDFTKTGQLKARQMASIFCCFKDTERAAGRPEVDKNRLNHYSGKYNFHLSSESSDEKGIWEYCFNLFSYELEKILIK